MDQWVTHTGYKTPPLVLAIQVVILFGTAIDWLIEHYA